MLTLYPAIDIRGGRAVRLLQGDYDRETGYDADPADAARRWVDGGAAIVHVVDLDGARDGSAGEPRGRRADRRAPSTFRVQVGGGLRDAASVDAVFAAGAGAPSSAPPPSAIPACSGALADAHGDRIVASVDARGGRVAVEGWEQATETAVEDAISDLGGRGVRRFVYTPVEVDGTLEGPGIDRARAGARRLRRDRSRADLLRGRRHRSTTSSGCGEFADRPLGGVIVGRALYERRFTVAEALERPRRQREEGTEWD